MEAIQKKLGGALLGDRFFIMGQVGAILLLFPSLQFMSHPYFAVACIALAITLAWDLWRGRTKSASYIFGGTVLACGIFLLVNTLTMSIVPAALPEAEETLAGLAALVQGGGNLTSAQTFGGLQAVANLTMPAILMLVGGMANLLFVIGGLMGIMSARTM